MGNTRFRLKLGRAAHGMLIAMAILALQSCGGGSGGGSVNNPESSGPPPIASAGMYLKAGQPTGVQYVDGSGTSARFFKPGALALDSVGNVWVEDVDPNADALASVGAETTLRTVDAAGAVKTIAWSARPGSRGYAGLVSDGYGNVYERQIGTTYLGDTSTILSAAFSTLKPATVAPDLRVGQSCSVSRNNLLVGVDRQGALYCLGEVSERQVLYKLKGDEPAVVMAKYDFFVVSNGAASTATYGSLTEIVFDAAGNGYFIDRRAYSGRGAPVYVDLRRISPSGEFSTVFSNPIPYSISVDGPTGTASMMDPKELQVDAAGNVYFRDAGGVDGRSGNYIRKWTPAGAITTVAGPFEAPAPNNPAAPLNYSISTTGEILRFEGLQLFAYSANGSKRVVAGHAVVPASTAGGTDGPGIQARFNTPLGVALDDRANIYVADCDNHVVRKIDASGNVSTFAGQIGAPGNEDGIGSTARFACPRAIVFDGQGSLYVTHDGAYTGATYTAYRLRRIEVATGAVTSVLASAELNVNALAADASGKIYTNDLKNLSLRVFDPKTQTLAYLAEGAIPFVAHFNYGREFRGLAVDGAGNAYHLDPVDAKLRKISPGGSVSLLPGVAGQTTFAATSGLALDKSGNLYVADTGRHLVRKIAPDGSMTTLAGTPSVSNAVAGALPGSLGLPMGLALRQIGTRTELVVTDQNAVLSIALP